MRLNYSSTINYVVPNEGDHRVIVPAGGEGDIHRTASSNNVNVSVGNARLVASEFDLFQNGFMCLKQVSGVTDFFDDQQVTDIYYSELETLLKETLGASKVIIFDHTKRSSSNQEQISLKVKSPANIAHVDYTASSGSKRAAALAKASGNSHLMEQRHIILNIWRAARGKVESHPLALLDTQTLDADDLIPTVVEHPSRLGEIYEVAHNSGHQWYFYPELKSDELLIFLGYDSIHPKACTPHTSIETADCANKKPRYSLELRACLFF